MRLLYLVFGIAALANAQFVPPPKYDKIVESKAHPGVKISYKSPKICETTPGVKSYSGYIHIPKGSLADLGVVHAYEINLFFWFFESRNDQANAPFALWLNGGPGTSSLKSLFHGTGPCNVKDDSTTTTLNPFSWNNDANILYVDQPVQTGFSYDVLMNVTFNHFSSGPGAQPVRPGQSASKTNPSIQNGVFASQSAFNTANTTGIAARTMWRFMQAFVGDFPEYKPKNNELSIWGTAYAGRWAPDLASYFLNQSKSAKSGEVALKIKSIGVVNGFIDMETQQLKFPQFAYNNTYGIQAVDQGVYAGVSRNYWSEDGCGTRLKQCRAQAAKADPDQVGNAGEVVNLCAHVLTVCSNVAGGYSLLSGRSQSDVTRTNPFSLSPYYIGYLNSEPVMSALGVARNFTPEQFVVRAAFDSYDPALGGHLEKIGQLLDSGVTVALAYGDRDYSNNWIGGEAVSTAINYTNSAAFKAAGYQDMQVNASFVGGQVRQVGQLSFTRVYDAGQEAFAYQPEALQKIFSRAISGKDIASGAQAALDSTYSTKGASSTWFHKNQVPKCPTKTECYVLDRSSCSDLQKDAIAQGYGIIKNHRLTGYTPNIPDYLDPAYLKKPKPVGC
ncbi:alpha/beta-hydrolase [Microthyrium microscopicum]|uniref:Alpha/beta-hydrolase n=1 Tax=Microthyrium microscopicum TaxID=703497 RepID=A0A6A6U8Q7_9PEZI|nr:alpha/beta-hydrolase [Microthyrium microscopicum]